MAEPDLCILTLSCASLLIFALRSGSFEARHVFLAALASATAAALGGLVAWRWRERTEQDTLRSRGQTSVANLKLLLLLIRRTEGRMKDYLQRGQDVPRASGRQTHERFLFLEETIEKMVFLSESTLRALEAWSDVVPEADLRGQIRDLVDLKRRADDAEELKGRLEAEARSEGRPEASEALIHELAWAHENAERLRASAVAREATLSDFVGLA